MKYSTGIDTGKRNFELLNLIKENIKKTRKDLVDLIVNSDKFIYKGKNERSIAWGLVLTAKSSKVNKAYEVREVNNTKGLFICWNDFTMVYFR
jgi:hypothetical protein